MFSDVGYSYCIYQACELVFYWTFPLFRTVYLDVIAYPSTYPCQWVSQCVSKWQFQIGDCYSISELCELVWDESKHRKGRLCITALLFLDPFRQKGMRPDGDMWRSRNTEPKGPCETIETLLFSIWGQTDPGPTDAQYCLGVIWSTGR